MSIHLLDELSVRRDDGNDATRDAPWAVLLIVFGGDAVAWLQYLEREGTCAQRRDDLPLARAVVTWCKRNESLRDKLTALASRLRTSAN